MNLPDKIKALPLTDAMLLRAVRCSTVRGSTVRLTREVGPYEVTEPTPELRSLAVAIINEVAALAAHAAPGAPVAWRVQVEDLWFHAASREGLIAALGVKLGRTISPDDAQPLYAAPTAAQPVAPPAGYALVPIEPTQAQMLAGEEAFVATARPGATWAEHTGNVYRAMLSAAQADTQGGE